MQKRIFYVNIIKIFVICEGIVIKNTITKLSVVLCLILVSALTFTACREKSVYAENSDFESYPEYWNSFNDSSDDTEGEIYLPDRTDTTNNVESSAEDKTNSSTSTEDTEASSDDPTANFTEDEDDTTNSSSSSSSGDSSSSSSSSSSGSSTNQGPAWHFD